MVPNLIIFHIFMEPYVPRVETSSFVLLGEARCVEYLSEKCDPASLGVKRVASAIEKTKQATPISFDVRDAYTCQSGVPNK